MYYKIVVLLAFGLVSANSQRLAPGVPPQHYQQPHQQYQQHPQQHQQHPQQNLPPGVSQQQYQQQQQMQYQQVPVQQQPPVQQVPVHQQVPVQQVPQGQTGGQHAAHAHHGQQQVLNAANIQHEREHIQEHMRVPIDTSKMSEAELQFHYFKMHDSDNNNKLDGCELIKSLIHWHANEEVKDENNAEKHTNEKRGKTYTDEKLIEIIDKALSFMDLNKDGYVDYTEFHTNQPSSTSGNKPKNN